MSITAVILAGGQGTRIRALYPDVPKPMIAVAGKPFLYWPTAYFAQHGIREFIYSTGYKGDQIERWCADGTMPGIERMVAHETEPLGTGGGLLHALDHCAEWVLVANGDSLCIGGLPELLAFADDAQLAGGLVGVYQNDTARFGSLDVDAAGRMRAFREKVPGQGYINAGVYLFRKAALLALQVSGPCSIERDLIPRLLAAGAVMKVALVRDADGFVDIGTPETVGAGETFIRRYGAAFAFPRDAQAR